MQLLCFADGDKYKLEERGLRIEKLDLRDNGTYECRAEVSSHGNLKVRKITVDVQCELFIRCIRCLTYNIVVFTFIAAVYTVNRKIQAKMFCHIFYITWPILIKFQ